jgi:hypothetical protein
VSHRTGGGAWQKRHWSGGSFRTGAQPAARRTRGGRAGAALVAAQHAARRPQSLATGPGRPSQLPPFPSPQLPWASPRPADFEFLSTSCGLKLGATQWKTCGVDTAGFVNRAQESAFSIPAWVDQIANAGKYAVSGAVGAASGAVGAASGVAAGAFGAASGAAGGVMRGLGGAAGSAIPAPFGRRLQAGQCSA